MSKSKEFIPRFPEKGAKHIPREKFKVTREGLAATFYLQKEPDWFNKLPDDTTINYLPINVPMICFIKIAFNRLRTCPHSREYGKFGTVLTELFLKLKGIRPVKYYTEESLWNDLLIKKWNYNEKALSAKEKEDLEKEILTYRKPATIFPSFKESLITKLYKTSNWLKVEYLTYDRYEEGYDFTKECEHRIVFDEVVDYLCFSEWDLYMIITPNQAGNNEIGKYLSQEWIRQPQIRIFPC